jgi:hypothetical protein
MSVIDPKVKTPLVVKMSNDIINITKFVEDFDKNDKKVNTIYDFFVQSNPGNYDKDGVIKLFKGVYTKHKPEILKLLNTKLYYFDRLIWRYVLSTDMIRQFFKARGIRNVYSTMDYMKATNTPMESDSSGFVEYRSTNNNIFIRYIDREVQEVKNIKFDTKFVAKDKAMAQLIASKNKIKFFASMEDEDIASMVTDVKFAQYNKHECVISEGDDDVDIFFLMNGECRVQAGRATLGLIGEQQVFGEFSILTGERRTATIKANKPSIIISFKLDLSKFDKNPCAYSFLYRNVSVELIKKIKQMNARK